MRREFCFILAAILLVTSCIPSAHSEGESVHVVYISCAQDFVRFAYNCMLEEYSKGKTFELTSDLDLSGLEFAPVPYFAGTFRGNHHKVSGIRIGQDGSRQGMFRSVAVGATIMDLTVSGKVAPQGTAMYIGGIAGDNAGCILNCCFDGEVSGIEKVGGIVGWNRGTVSGCSMNGTVTGEHQTGGIAGCNEGTVTACRNNASVNNVMIIPREKSRDFLDFSTFDVSSISEDDFLNITDLGGICGENRNIISACRNEGDVGYHNMAYNVGGIVGKNTGFIQSSKNRGQIKGRKDVGGIAGQLIPYTELDLSQGKLDALASEINGLKTLIAAASADASGAASWILGDLNGLDAGAQRAIDLLRSLAEDYVKDNLGLVDSIRDLIRFDPETGELVLDLLPLNPETGELFPEGSVVYDPESGSVKIGDRITLDPMTGIVTLDGTMLLPPDTAELTEALDSLWWLSSNLNSKIDGSVSTLAGDVTRISDQMAQVFDTLFATVEDMADIRLETEDLSASQAYKRNRGAIDACVNEGSVQAETNSGGVVGASAFEIAFDMEDRLNTSELLLSHTREYLFAAIRDCENRGDIRATKNNCGGIAGLIDDGSVTNATELGRVVSEKGDCVGGIAGQSKGTIRNCRARVLLAGQKYVGGIAGLGSDIHDCCSMVMMERAAEYVGAVAGWTEGTAAGNYYVASIGGVDNVSRIGACTPVSEQEMLQREGIPREFSSLTVQFYCEENLLQTTAVPFGGCVDVFPAVEERENSYWVWDAVPGEPIYHDTEIRGSYHTPIETLSSGEEPPRYLVEGAFSEGQTLLVESGKPVEAIHALLAAGLTVDGYRGRLRVHARTEAVGTLYVYGKGEKNGREERSYTRDGSYIVFEMENGESFVYAEREKPDLRRNIVILITAAFLELVLIVLWLRRRKRKIMKAQARKQQQGRSAITKETD